MVKIINIKTKDEKTIKIYNALYSKSKSIALEKALDLLYKNKKMRDIYFDPEKIKNLMPVKKTAPKVQKAKESISEKNQKREKDEYSNW